MPLALLEHVNLNITDRDTAYEFYVTGLGGVVQPVSTNDRQLHVNAGASQFHLLLKSSYIEGVVPVEEAQVWAGHIELWTREPLEAIQQRLSQLYPDRSSWNREEASPASGGQPHLLCTCPWGEILAETLARRRRSIARATTATNKRRGCSSTRRPT